MDLRLIDYVTYIGASVGMTVWVANTLQSNGRIFLVSVLKETGLADSVNHLLVVGFYLINFGAAALLINAGNALGSVADLLQATVTRLGIVLLVLGFMHFFNMFVLYRIRRPRKTIPPPPTPSYSASAGV